MCRCVVCLVLSLCVSFLALCALRWGWKEDRRVTCRCENTTQKKGDPIQFGRLQTLYAHFAVWSRCAQKSWGRTCRQAGPKAQQKQKQGSRHAFGQRSMRNKNIAQPTRRQLVWIPGASKEPRSHGQLLLGQADAVLV